MDLWESALSFLGCAGAPDRARSTARILIALDAWGIVQRFPDGRFANDPEAAEQLVRSRR